MRLFILSLMVALGFLGIGAAKAEYGCQSGFVPVYQGNRQVCVADYNLPVWRQQQGQQKPAEIWEDRYGAVARSNINQDYTVSVDQKSKRDAEKDAMERCQGNCKIITNFRNSCLGASWGKGRGGRTLFRGGDTKQDAEQESLKACQSETDGDCEIVYSACSLPVRVQ